MIRSIEVYKYPQQYGVGAYQKPQLVGILNHLYTATAKVVDFGDAQIDITCELNENNRALVQNGSFVNVQMMKGTSVPYNGILNTTQQITTVSLYSIFNVKINAQTGIISLTAEPMANILRSGVTGYNGPVYTTSGNGWNAQGSLVFPNGRQSVGSTRLYPNLYIASYKMQNGEQFKLKGADHRTGLEVAGGKDYSMRDYWAGEFFKAAPASIDGPTIYQMDHVGNLDRNFMLSDRTTVSGIDVEIDTSDVYNAVLHFATYEIKDSSVSKAVYYLQQGSEGFLRFPEARNMLKFDKTGFNKINGNYKQWPTGKIYVKDWTDGMKDEVANGGGGVLGDGTSIDIQRAANWINSQALDWTYANYQKNDPKVVINIDFSELKHQLGEVKFEGNVQEAYDELSALQLGDTVMYRHKELDWQIQSRVSGYEYNILRDEYTKLTIGQGTTNIYKRFNK